MQRPDRRGAADHRDTIAFTTALTRSASAAPVARHRLPELRPWTERLAQAVAEVLAGARHAGQLCDVATLDVLRLLQRGAGRLGSRPGALRPVVGSVHISEPCAGVAEACAVIDTGVRVRALALRLEAVDGRWRCTALHVG